MKTLFIIVCLALAPVTYSQTTNDTDVPQPQDLPTFNHTYKAEAFIDKVKQLMPLKDDESDYQLIRRYFEQHNIVLHPPEAMFLEGKFHMLFVKATPSDQKKIQALFTKVEGEK